MLYPEYSPRVTVRKLLLYERLLVHLHLFHLQCRQQYSTCRQLFCTARILHFCAAISVAGGPRSEKICRSHETLDVYRSWFSQQLLPLKPIQNPGDKHTAFLTQLLPILVRIRETSYLGTSLSFNSPELVQSRPESLASILDAINQ